MPAWAPGSYASNLVLGDINNAWDVLVRDPQTGTARRVSVQTGGGQANVYSPRLVGEWAIIAFESGARQLVPGDTNGIFDMSSVASRRS